MRLKVAKGQEKAAQKKKSQKTSSKKMVGALLNDVSRDAATIASETLAAFDSGYRKQAGLGEDEDPWTGDEERQQFLDHIFSKTFVNISRGSASLKRWRSGQPPPGKKGVEETAARHGGLASEKTGGKQRACTFLIAIETLKKAKELCAPKAGTLRQLGWVCEV